MKKKKKPPPKKKKPAAPPKRKGLGIWIGLIFFVSIWMFILGIFVGRGTAPVQFDIEKLQKELATLKAEFVKKEQERFNDRGDQAGDKTELRFYEVLKKPRNDEKLDTEIIRKPDTGILPKATDTENKKTMSLPASGSISTPLKGETSAAVKEPAIQTDSGLKKAVKPQVGEATGSSRKGTAGFTVKGPETAPHLTIQVASFKDPKVADRMVKDLIGKGYPAYRTIGDVRGKGTWFRVRIGTYKNREDAGATLYRLKKDGVEAILVKR